jgi:hypothetical protein
MGFPGVPSPANLTAWKPYLGCNILAEEKRVPLSNIRYRDGKQRCA